MSDDLVKRADAFRLGSRPTDQQVDQANRLIDHMSSRIDQLEAKLDSALLALERIELSTDTREQGGIAMATLAKLKGEDRG
jgi:TolA-binding protein